MKTLHPRLVGTAALLGGLLALSPACSKPQPPQLTPKEATVTDVAATGFDLRVKMDATNPNKFPISVRAVTAHVIIDGKQDLGTVTSTQAIDLPASATTSIDVPLNVKWKNLAGVATLAQATKPVPYTLDGTATVGGESLNVDLPFRMNGQITPQQLQQAVTKSLQNLGLPGALPPIPVAH
ncbi:MAG: hypothetical protein JWP97_2093 [Labilithrix sp.]|nr:hypothetical protein [Labilithrix sp.]